MEDPIRTRFGSEVEIRYRCDDYSEDNDDGTLFVHAFYVEHPKMDPLIIPTWELRAKGGANYIAKVAAAAPIAHCTGKHEGDVARTGLERAGGTRGL